MQKAKRKLTTLLLGWAVIQLFPSVVCAQPYFEQGYAHNDYLHKKPLFDALNNGYTHIEADIFLFKDSLIVAHWFPYLKERRTLEALYLEPLNRYVNNNALVNNTPVITLVIDIKSSSRKTYLALNTLLQKYKSMLSSYENGAFKQGKVNIVLTGHKPVDLISKETNRLVMLDDFLDHASPVANHNLFAMASCKYANVLKWTGKGRIPAKEKNKLLNLVNRAHSQGKKARLWASPENENVWNELLNCGIDYINTDRLVQLKDFCKSRFNTVNNQNQTTEDYYSNCN